MLLEDIHYFAEFDVMVISLFNVGRLPRPEWYEDGVDEYQGAVCSEVEVLPMKIFVDEQRFPLIAHWPPVRGRRQILGSDISAIEEITLALISQ